MDQKELQEVIATAPRYARISLRFALVVDGDAKKFEGLLKKTFGADQRFSLETLSVENDFFEIFKTLRTRLVDVADFAKKFAPFVHGTYVYPPKPFYLHLMQLEDTGIWQIRLYEGELLMNQYVANEIRGMLSCHKLLESSSIFWDSEGTLFVRIPDETIAFAVAEFLELLLGQRVELN